MADTPEKKRRGKAVKPKKGEAATFVPGDGAAPKDFDAAKLAEELHLWWQDGDGQTFIVGQDPKEQLVLTGGEEMMKPVPQIWSQYPEKKVINLLKMKWVRVKPRDGEPIGNAESVLMHVMEKRRLDEVVKSLAGYTAGIYHDPTGLRMLVKTSPRLIEPKKGSWDNVREFLETKLSIEGGSDQTPYFHGWMKTALEGLYLGGPGNFRPGQCIIFAGRANSAKSRIQHQIITPLLGSRSADPGPYLFGRTDFNGEVFTAEHLMMEDPASGTRNADRIYFGEMLKGLVVNDVQRLHAKREDAIMVSPFFRTTISVNDDPDKMRVLPLLTPDMKDKFMLFHISPKQFHLLANDTLAARAEFRRLITADLPAYAYWLLNEFEIPNELRSTRFGIKEWHHPTLAMELFDDTPAAELLTLIDAAVFQWADGKNGGGGTKYKLWDLKSDAGEDEEGVWEGSALDLEKLLLGDWPDLTCTVHREAKKLALHNRIDRLLGRLKEDQPERVVHKRSGMKRWWRVLMPLE